MTNTTPQDLLRMLSEISKLSPDVRFGQLLANLAFLVEARAGKSIWDVEDSELLQVMEEHRTELARLEERLT